MKRPITVADILNSVEFELLQHSLMQDDVSEGIQRLKTYQARTRAELFGQGKSPTFEEVAGAQFNANEMMVTLIQVMNQRLEALRQEVRQAAYLKQRAPSIPDAALNRSLLGDPTLQESVVSAHRLDWSDVRLETSDVFAQYPSNVDAQIGALNSLIESVQLASSPIEMEVRQSNIPLIGNLLSRIRRALHELVLFYTNKVVRRQTEINQLQSALLQELVALHRAQAQEIALLRQHLRRLTAAETGNDMDADR